MQKFVSDGAETMSAVLDGSDGRAGGPPVIDVPGNVPPSRCAESPFTLVTTLAADQSTG
jgi:hypothetical protein